MGMDLKLYDKNGNLLDERSFDYQETEISEYSYVIGISEDIFKKAVTIELIFYKQWENMELYNISTKSL